MVYKSLAFASYNLSEASTSRQGGQVRMLRDGQGEEEGGWGGGGGG